MITTRAHIYTLFMTSILLACNEMNFDGTNQTNRSEDMASTPECQGADCVVVDENPEDTEEGEFIVSEDSGTGVENNSGTAIDNDSGTGTTTSPELGSGSETVEYTTVTGRTGMQLQPETFLRNAPQLNATGITQYPGLPPGNQQGGHYEAVFIRDNAASRQQVCEAVLPGSTVLSYTTSAPTASGWLDNRGNGYWNLFIAEWTGSQWNRLCSGGADCLSKGYSFVNTIECRKPAP